MKILTCNPDGGAYHYILNGINSALSLSGNDVSRVTVKTKEVPADFDLYLGCSGWRQKIPTKTHRRGKIGIHVNPYGQKKVGNTDGGPTIDESKEAIQWTLNQQPDFVYCYCSETYIPEYFGFWTTKHGIPVVQMPTAADITIYKPKPPEDRFKCEIGWVGGKWPYKARMLEKYLVPLIKTKKSLIYGWGNTWGNNKAISDNEVPILFSTAKICPSVSEGHTSIHPVDVPERVFKVPAGGGFTIHTPSPAINDLFGDAVPMAKNPAHWMELIEFYLKNDKARIEQAKKERECILEKHTYFDRCLGIAKILGDSSLADNLKAAKAVEIKL
jgi:spore maturation protein CgeB